MNNNNTILAIAFLIAGTLLTTAVTTMVPVAYADNEIEAEEESSGAIADCDNNEVERAGFDCIAIAAADIEVDIGRGIPPKLPVMNGFGTSLEE